MSGPPAGLLFVPLPSAASLMAIGRSPHIWFNVGPTGHRRKPMFGNFQLASSIYQSIYRLSMKILTTNRLYLRTWQEEDFPLAKSLWGNADVMTFLGGPLSDEKVLEKMHAEMACQEKHGLQYWPIFETDTDEFVGCCGMRPWHRS